MGLVGRWQLHPLHLYLVRSYLELEDLVLPLEGKGYCTSVEQLGEVTRREYPTMQQLDIVVNDEIHPTLVDALNTLTKPYLWVDSVWFPEFGGQQAWRTVGAITADNNVVLGVQTPGDDDTYGGLLTVEVHHKVRLPEVLLPTFPPAPPGNRGPVRVPHSSFRPERTDDDDNSEVELMQQTSYAKGSSGDQQMAVYQQISDTPHVRSGQLAANMRDRNGKVHRTPLICWFDNAEPDGRYLTEVERTRTGEPLYTIVPADAGAIARRVDGLIAAARS